MTAIQIILKGALIMLINVVFFVALVPFLGISMLWLIKEMTKEFKNLEE